jgi:hypothetical protein
MHQGSNYLNDGSGSNPPAIWDDGITLPADAKREADSQRAMLGANLYVKEDGSVGVITSSDATLPTIAKKKSATDAVVIILSADPLPINTGGDAKINVPLPVGTD